MHKLTGVSTSVTAFVGVTADGPLNAAALVHSFDDYEARFGGLSAASDLSHAVRQFFQNGGNDAFVVRTLDGHAAVLGDRAMHEGIYALEDVDLFNLLCLPGVADDEVLTAAAAYCEERGALLIMDAPAAAQTPEQILATVSGNGFPKSGHAALYYPWVYVASELDGDKRRLAPPCGSVAGLYARTDRDRGLWKAPAGNRAALQEVRALQHLVTDEQAEQLNRLGVNCLRIFPTLGAVSWGARTLGAESDPEYKYVPVRRMADFIEESLFRGLEWALFEANDETLWAQIRSLVEPFLHDLFVAGAFQGSTAREAYWVQCDGQSTSPTDLELGLVTVLVGFAPLKPAEFVTVSIQQRAGWPRPAPESESAPAVSG